MSGGILDRMEQAVARVRERLLTRPDHPLPAPEIQTIADPAEFRVIALESLVTMKLLSNRDKDRTHLRDLIGVGLVDASWLTKVPPELAGRLKHLLDTPDA